MKQFELETKAGKSNKKYNDTKTSHMQNRALENIGLFITCMVDIIIGPVIQAPCQKYFLSFSVCLWLGK
jgi:hypothetical protein